MFGSLGRDGRGSTSGNSKGVSCRPKNLDDKPQIIDKTVVFFGFGAQLIKGTEEDSNISITAVQFAMP